jgi:RHS repeat-associated protein
MGGGVGGMVYSIKWTGSTPETRNSELLFSHANHRGDVIARSDSSGSLTSFALYEAYGTRPYEWGSDPDRQKANTKEEEKDLGLLNDTMRYRDLETGTYLTRDPAGFKDGPNIYCYVHCNPITKFDALGLWGEDVHDKDTRNWLQDMPGFSERYSGSPNAAERVAKACNGVDKWLGGKSFMPNFVGGNQGYHFNTNKKGQEDSRIVHARNHLEKAIELQNKANEQREKGLTEAASKTEKKALKELGQGLHPLQDTKSHTPEVTRDDAPFGLGLWKDHDTSKNSIVDNKDKRPSEYAETKTVTQEYVTEFLDRTDSNKENRELANLYYSVSRNEGSQKSKDERSRNNKTSSNKR